ncbi:MAG: hypothetical protein ACO1PN_03735 [Betaproteobacteria bacterium]
MKLITKFLARPAETMTPMDSASLISAELAPASFAPAKALCSQVGHPAATAHPAWISRRVFGSRISSYSKSICIFFRVVMFFLFWASVLLWKIGITAGTKRSLQHD